MQQTGNHLNVNEQRQRPQFSDSDDAITNGPFPTLTFDQNHSNISNFEQQQQTQQQQLQQSNPNNINNPNLAIPHQVIYIFILFGGLSGDKHKK